MLFNLDFLNKGRLFPPNEELDRLFMYKQNKKLFEHDLQHVLVGYQERIRNIINRFNDTDWTQFEYNMYSLDFDYFELLSVKTADLTVGDPPTITIKKRELTQEEIENGEESAREEADKIAQDNLKALCENSALDCKLSPIIIDISRYGDSVVRIYQQTKDGKTVNNFTVISPELWFPVVVREV